ncbi:hypothetical protein EWB00_004096, partial [Schistosoma japonicum]
SRSSQDYQERLKYLILSNNVYLKANEISTEESQRSVKELAERAVQDLDIPNEAMTAIVDCYTQVGKKIAEDRMPNETQSNETEASCARLETPFKYDFKLIKRKILSLEERSYYKLYYLFIIQLLAKNNITRPIEFLP